MTPSVKLVNLNEKLFLKLYTNINLKIYVFKLYIYVDLKRHASKLYKYIDVKKYYFIY
jgi:hypothetical protein